MRELKDLRGVNSDLQISNPQVNVEIDRDKARSLGVSAQAIEDALYDAYGSRQISTIYAPNDEYKVEMEVEPQYQDDPATLSLLYVRSQGGPLVPLSTVVKFVRGRGTVADQSFGATAGGYDFIRPCSRRVARQRPQGSADPRAQYPAGIFHHQLSRDRASFSGFTGRPRTAARDDHPHHLPGTWNPLRKLHPSDHDSVGASRGRLRRAGHLDGCSGCSWTFSRSSG